MMRRGACPTVFAPLPSGDGLLARIKPPGSRLHAAAARTLAQAAATHGNGVIELTSRGNVQVRGLTEASAPHFAAAMVAAGLACADPAAERRRNVLLNPLAAAPARRLAAELEATLAADAGLAALPDKFGFLVEGGGLPLGDVSFDVRLCGVGERWLVWPDGARAAACGAGAAALELARAFCRLASLARRAREVSAGALFAAAGLHPTETLPTPAACVPIGKLAGGFGVGLAFGATDAATFAALADLAERDGNGTLWLTPWRAVVFGGVAADPSPQPPPTRGGRASTTPPLLVGGGWGEGSLSDEAASLGLIVDPDDPRRRLIACPGQPACAGGHAATRRDAARLASLLPGLAAHLSGCAKGCAHPAPAPLTLVAEPDGYAVVRNGTAAGAPERRGLSIPELAAMLQP